LWQHPSNKYGPLTRNSSCAASCTNSCINAVNHTLQRTLHHTLQHTCTNSCIHGVYTEELTNLHVHSKSRNLQCTWRTNLQVHSDTRCQSRTMIHSLYLCMHACMYVCMYIYRYVYRDLLLSRDENASVLFETRMNILHARNEDRDLSLQR